MKKYKPTKQEVKQLEEARKKLAEREKRKPSGIGRIMKAVAAQKG